MISGMICHPRLGEATLGVRVAVDRPGGGFVPCNVESRQLGKERQVTVGQMVVDPPGQGLPVTRFLEIVDVWRHDDTDSSALVAVCILTIPDMPGEVRFIACAVEFLLVAELIDLARTVSRSNRDAPELCLQRLEQI